MIFRFVRERVTYKPWRPAVEAAGLLFGAFIGLAGKGAKACWNGLRGIPKPAPLDPKQLKNIVIIRPDRIGDAVLSTPAFRAVRQAAPQARITVIAAASNAPLIKQLPMIDEVVTLAGDRFADWWPARNTLKPLRQIQPDLIIALQISWPAALLSGWLKGKRRLGFDAQGMGWLFTDPVAYPFLKVKAHQVAVNLYLLKAIGMPVPPAEQARLEVPVTSEGRKAIERWLQQQNAAQGKLIVIHPGSRSAYTQWMPSRFAVVADQLAANPENQVIILCGPREEHIVERMTRSMKHVVKVAKGLTLEVVIALLERSSLFIGNATGTMHLASAVCPRVIAIIGGTHPQDCPERWAPWGNKHRVVHKTPEETVGFSTARWAGPEGLKFIQPQDVLAAAAS